MGFNHRVPALATACIASAALCLTVLAGLSCEFLDVTAEPDMLLLSANDIQMTVQTASIGILCDNGFYEREGDKMWEISRLFLFIALALGGLSTALAWAVTTFLAPTEFNWRLLSFFASLTAVLQVPIFLLFEAEPCAGFPERQTCSLGLGSYYVIASVIFWVAVTLATQLLDPPMWAMELSAWRVKASDEMRQGRMERDLEVGEDGFPVVRGEFIRDPPEDSKRNNTGCFGSSKQKRVTEIRANSTESLQEEDFDDVLPQRSHTRSAGSRRPQSTRSTRSSGRYAGGASVDPRIEITDEGKTIQSQERFSRRRQMASPSQASSQAYSQSRRSAGGRPSRLTLLEDFDPVVEITEEGKTMISQERFEKASSPRVMQSPTSMDASVDESLLFDDLDSNIELTDEAKTAISEEQFQRNHGLQYRHSFDGPVQNHRNVEHGPRPTEDGFAMSPLRVESRLSQKNANLSTDSSASVRRTLSDDVIGYGRDVSLLDKSSVAAPHAASPARSAAVRSRSSAKSPGRSTAKSPGRSSVQQKPVYGGINSFAFEQTSQPALSGAAILSDLQTDENEVRNSHNPRLVRNKSFSSAPSRQPATEAGSALLSSGPFEPSAFADDENDDPSELISGEKYATGLRALTSKIKLDSKRRKSRRKRRLGYTQMIDDYDSDDSIHDKTPPFEVNIQPEQFGRNPNGMHQISDDEQEELMDDWDALHVATAAGAGKGQQEGQNTSFDGPLHWPTGNVSMDSYHESITTYHSDPEPAYYESEETRSELSLSTMGSAPPDAARDFEDSSTLSSSSASNDVSPYEKSSRSRGRGGRSRRRRARQHSPVSIKSSASLISATINEETVQDIIAESSAGEEELGTTYSLARTKSAPESRSGSFDRIELARREMSLSTAGVSSSGAMSQQSQTEDEVIRSPFRNTAMVTPTSETSEVIHSPSRTPASNNRGYREEEPPLLPTMDNRFGRDDELRFDDSEQRRLRSHSSSALHRHARAPQESVRALEAKSLSPNRTRVSSSYQSSPMHRDIGMSPQSARALEAKSLSPDRTRALNSYEWKDNVEPGRGVISARDATSKNRMDLEASSDVDLVERAREIRIQRLRKQKSARPDIPLLSTSFDRPDSAPNTPNRRNHTPDDESALVSFVDSEPGDALPVSTGSIVNGFESDSVAQSDGHVSEDSDDVYRKYGSSRVIDDLDLQLTLVRRPYGAEYGDDEASL